MGLMGLMGILDTVRFGRGIPNSQKPIPTTLALGDEFGPLRLD